HLRQEAVLEHKPGEGLHLTVPEEFLFGHAECVFEQPAVAGGIAQIDSPSPQYPLSMAPEVHAVHDPEPALESIPPRPVGQIERPLLRLSLDLERSDLFRADRRIGVDAFGTA